MDGAIATTSLANERPAANRNPRRKVASAEGGWQSSSFMHASELNIRPTVHRKPNSTNVLVLVPAILAMACNKTPIWDSELTFRQCLARRWPWARRGGRNVCVARTWHAAPAPTPIAAEKRRQVCLRRGRGPGTSTEQERSSVPEPDPEPKSRRRLGGKAQGRLRPQGSTRRRRAFDQ